MSFKARNSRLHLSSNVENLRSAIFTQCGGQTSRGSLATVEYGREVRKRRESGEIMAATIDAPQQWVENIAMLRLPEPADRRLQQLMDRNNEGLLSEQETADLAALAELSEQLSLVRAEALHLLGRKP